MQILRFKNRMNVEDTAIEICDQFTLYTIRRGSRVNVRWCQKDSLKIVIVDEMKQHILLPPGQSETIGH